MSLFVSDEARRIGCAVQPNQYCQGRQCMAWRQLEDGRGWCGRVAVPIEAIAPIVDTAMKELKKSRLIGAAILKGML